MLAAIALLLMGPVPPPRDRPRAVEGVARVAGTDRPAARVRLHVFDQVDPAQIVATDDEGRFRVPLKDGHNLPLAGHREQSCWAEAEGVGRWTVEALQQPRYNQPPESLRATVNSALAKPVGATWEGGLLRVEYPEPGEVEVLVRGPDGAPLADRPVQVTPVWELGEASHGPAEARFTGRLDAEGRFRMRWFASSRRLRVAVPGVGFGATGPIEVKDGATARVDLPPLARFGSIAGTLDAKLVGPEVFVHLDPEHLAPAACDASGRFAFDDVPPGHYSLRASKDGDRSSRITGAAPVLVWLAPGQKVEGLRIDPLPALPPEAAAREKAQQAKMLEQFNGKPGVVVWAEGTVRDAAGRPLEKADVYLRAAHHGGLRMEEDVLATITDAQGHYSFSGEVHPTTESPVLVAKVPGRPPAVANAAARTVANDRPAHVDLTVADAGGSATVTVLRDGRPLPGARVQLEATASAAILAGFGWARGSGGPEKFKALVEPSAVTGPDGVARLGELIPGLYSVHATDNAQGVDRQVRGLFGPQDGVNTGEVTGVAVVAGREAATTVPIATKAAGRAAHKVRFRVLRPDGRPVAGETVSFQFGQRDSATWNTSLDVDADGVGEHAFESPGLWVIAVQFRDTPVRSFPLAEPYYEAEALVAVSPAVPDREPIRLVGVLHEAGSIRVRLLGLDGRPARGMVEIPSPFDRNGPFASTDPNGEVVLRGLAARKYQVQGYVEAPGPPPMSWGGATPDDAALRGPFVVVPGVAEVAVTSGRETFLELKARRVGYLRGKIPPAEGQGPADVSVRPFYDQRVLQPVWRNDPATGEFFGGPFLGGPLTLQFVRPMADGSERNSGRQEVQVVEGEVTRVDLKPGPVEPEDDARRNRSVMLGMGGISVNEGLPRVEPPTVFLPDGRTPAFAAQATLFEPGHAGPTALGRADGSGRLTWRGAWSSADPDERDKSGDVPGPTLVVSLPGRCGPTVVRLDEIRGGRVVLADAPAVEGRVVVIGRPADGGSGVRVLAAHQGGGVLDGVLSRQITPGPDGRFRLDGLAPGRYLVQAIRDGLWVSKSAEVRVEANQAPAPVALEIPEPGESATLELVDERGRPFADRAVAPIRPEGPFAALWPTDRRTDAAGRITLPGLEAGPHAATVEGTGDRAAFTVRAAAADRAPEPARRITLHRAGP